jgi:hypothetical protein
MVFRIALPWYRSWQKAHLDAAVANQLEKRHRLGSASSERFEQQRIVEGLALRQYRCHATDEHAEHNGTSCANRMSPDHVGRKSSLESNGVHIREIDQTHHSTL